EKSGPSPDLSQFNKSTLHLQKIRSIEGYGDVGNVGNFVVTYEDGSTWDSEVFDFYGSLKSGLAMQTVLEDLQFAVRTNSKVYLYSYDDFGGYYNGAYIIETDYVDGENRVNQIKFTNDVLFFDKSVTGYEFDVDGTSYEIDTSTWNIWYESLGSKIITDMQVAFESGSDINFDGFNYEFSYNTTASE
ncbi:MAG: hypothetical protein V3V61_08185, partial [Gammaproteobacteria bacterium]